MENAVSNVTPLRDGDANYRSPPANVEAEQALLGAILVNLGKTWLTSALPEVWLFAIGGLFIVVTLFMPRGIIGLFAARAAPASGQPSDAVPGTAAARSVAREAAG